MRARLSFLAGLALAVVAGCATVDPREDLRIEAEVKARLVAEKGANLTRLGVVSTNGTVYLSGAVEAPEPRAQAETLAREVRGVRRVVNTLEVRPTP
jgi:hyperosmotically inducible periplasmic protein